MRSPIKALYIVTPAIGLFFQRTYSTPWEHTAELQVEISAMAPQTDTFYPG
jgi:hypothetical protein